MPRCREWARSIAGDADGSRQVVCYQLPAIALRGTALVISPLIALMEDQVAKLVFARSARGANSLRSGSRDFTTGLRGLSGGKAGFSLYRTRASTGAGVPGDAGQAPARVDCN